MDRLKGKTALVIGGGTGIGRAVCEAFVKEGAFVALADRGHRGERDAFVDATVKMGRRALAIECNVLQEDEVKAAVDRTISEFGHLDIIVNNAGVTTPSQPAHTVPWDEWNRVMDINFRGVAFGMRYALPHMLERGYGRVINTASQLAHKAAPGIGVYCASKAAVVALTSSVAHEVASKGVTVNAVCPGPTDTPAWRASDADWNEWKRKQLPIERIADAEEIAWAYVYLASDEAAYMVGQSISPNGGDVMW